MTMNDDCDRSQWQPRYGWSNRETKKKKINDDLQKPRRRCVEIILMVLNFIEVASRCHLWYHRSRPIYTHAHFTHNCMCVWLDVARTKNKKQLEWRIACLYTSNRIIFIPTACHGQRKKKKEAERQSTHSGDRVSLGFGEWRRNNTSSTAAGRRVIHWCLNSYFNFYLYYPDMLCYVCCIISIKMFDDISHFMSTNWGRLRSNHCVSTSNMGNEKSQEKEK